MQSQHLNYTSIFNIIILCLLIFTSILDNVALGHDYINYGQNGIFISTAIILFKGNIKIRIPFNIIALSIVLLIWCCIANITNNVHYGSGIIYPFCLFIIFIFATSSNIKYKTFATFCSILSILVLLIQIFTNKYSNYNLGNVAIQIIALISSMMLLLLYWQHNKVKSIIYGSIALTNLILIIISTSKAALLSVIIVSVLFLYTNRRNVLCKTIYPFLIIFIVLFSIIFIYQLLIDTNSLKGRLLIYYTSFEVFKSSPILGHGIDGFFREYMMFQQQVLDSQEWSNYCYIADNSYRTFNIVLSIAIKYGLIAVLLFAGIFFIILKKAYSFRFKYRGFLFYIIIALFTLSLFSYPFEYKHILILFIFTIGICFKNHKSIKNFYWQPPRLRNSINKILSIVIILFSLHNLYYEIMWYKSQTNIDKDGIASYHKIYDNIYYNHNFLYNYAAELNYTENYSESNKVLDKLSWFINDYNTEILLGDNFYNLGEYQTAEHHFKTANKMVPNRFMPLLGLLNIYSQTSISKADSISHTIIEKKVKVKSKDVTRIKKLAKRWLANRILYDDLSIIN